MMKAKNSDDPFKFTAEPRKLLAKQDQNICQSVETQHIEQLINESPDQYAQFHPDTQLCTGVCDFDPCDISSVI